MSTNQWMAPNLTLTNEDITDLGGKSWLPYATPTTEWAGQIAQYGTLWQHYSGQSLQKTVDTARVGEDGAPLVYPLRINQFAFTADLHAALMWGQGEDENEFMRFIGRRKTPEDVTDPADEIGDRLSTLFWSVWLENGGQEVLREAGRLYQVFGGHVFKVVHDPSYLLGVRIESIAANVFFPIWHPSNYRQLLAVLISYRVSKDQAKSVWNIDLKEDWGIYVEIWTETEYAIRIDDRELKREANPYIHPVTKKGVIPFVYIPRMRTGSFWGRGGFPSVVGLAQEYNARAADIGDAIDDTTHRKVWGRNLRGTRLPNMGEVPNGEVINLGDTVPGMEQAPPELGVLDSAEIPESSLPFIQLLEAQMREKTFTAPVVLGIDEGSQRSAMTLSMRAIPTTAVIREYRGSWLMGMAYMAELCFLAMYIQPEKVELQAGVVKRKNDVDVTAFGYWIMPDFSPILPRDREALVQETIALYGAGLRSIEFALQRLGDVRDIKAELDRILAAEEQKRQQQIEVMETEAKFAPKPFGNTPPKQAPGHANNGGPRPQRKASRQPRPAPASDD